MFEELVDPPRDSTAVLPFALSTASAATVGLPTGTIGIPTGGATVVGIAADATGVVDSTTVNAQVVNTCTTDTLVSPDTELCQKLLNEACSGLFFLNHYIE